MAVALNTGDSGTPNAHTGFNGTAVTLSNTTYTVGAGTNVVLFAILTFGNNAGTDVTVSSVVWDDGGTNQSMTRIGGGIFNDTRVEIWYRQNPTTGNKTCKADWTTAADCVLGLVSFTNAGVPVDTPVTNTGTAGNPTTGAIASTADGATLAAYCLKENAAPSNSQTDLYTDNTTFAGTTASYETGGTSVTYTFGSATIAWAAMGIHIPVFSGVAGTPFIMQLGARRI